MIKRILAQGVLCSSRNHFPEGQNSSAKEHNLYFVFCEANSLVGTKRTNHLKGHEKLIENIMYLFCVPLFISLT